MQEYTNINTFKKDDSVTYESVGRPYLKGLPGKIVSFNLNNTSAQVLFTKQDGSTYQEWVGLGAIKKTPESGSIEDVIRNELRQVAEEFTTVSADYRRLSLRKNQLEGALRALNATFR